MCKSCAYTKYCVSSPILRPSQTFQCYTQAWRQGQNNVHVCHGHGVYNIRVQPVSFESLSQVKQECDNEETDAANVYEQIIASLSKQIEELSLSMDSLRQSDQNLSLSLRMAEQRAMEAETKLRHALDR